MKTYSQDYNSICLRTTYQLLMCHAETDTNQSNRKGLTPANGISPNFVFPQKVLSDSNVLYVVYCVRFSQL